MFSKVSLRVCLIGLALMLGTSRADEKAADKPSDQPETGAAGESKTHSAGGHHDGHHIGGPTHKPDPTEVRSDLAVWSFVVFMLLMFGLYKTAWPKLAHALEKREETITHHLTEAEAARVRAEKLLEQHAEKLDRVQEEVKAILAEARRDAEHTKAEIMATAQKEAEANRQRAVLEIERAKERALDELFGQMTKVVWTATEHVVGRTLTDGDHERLITEAVASVSGKKN